MFDPGCASHHLMENAPQMSKSLVTVPIEHIESVILVFAVRRDPGRGPRRTLWCGWRESDVEFGLGNPLRGWQ
jgi:hypothetical protein